MADYISREAAMKKRHGCNRDCSTCDFAIEGDSWCQGDVFVVDILRVPAADVRPVVRAHWIIPNKAHTDRPMPECSVCGWYVDDGAVKDFTYCPNCGADMREVEDG